MIKKALAVIPLILLFSCSRAEPRIPFGFMELVYYPGTTAPQERVSFFVIAEDNDGMDNLSELRLYYDREGLEWIIDSEDWVYYQEDGKHWIGSRSIAMVNDVSLPRGQYRAVLFNKGGEKTERPFTFDTPEQPRFPYPSFSLQDGAYRIDSRYPENSFIVYDNEGNVLRTIALVNTEGSTADLNLPGNAMLLALWARDEIYQTSALTEVISLR